MKDKRRNHPRPQFMREDWQDLAGQWQLVVGMFKLQEYGKQFG